MATKLGFSSAIALGMVGGSGVIAILLVNRRAAMSKRKVVGELGKDCEVSRPKLVVEAMGNKTDIYYFGFGSNMLRSRVTGRAVDGSQIEIISMEPAKVPGYHLAFSMRGFPPLEPTMASLERWEDDHDGTNGGKARTGTTPCIDHVFDETEGCHGALVHLTSDNYDKVWKSEGGGRPTSGYEEIVVTTYPYDGRDPVQAVTLRVRDHVRLKHEVSPSARYMNLLRDGAKELGLKHEYQEWLRRHPVQHLPPLLTHIAINNFVFMFTVGGMFNTRSLAKFQSWFLWKVFVSSESDKIDRHASNVASAIILLPGAGLGCILRFAMYLFGAPAHPFMKGILGRKKEVRIEPELAKPELAQIISADSKTTAA